ncbi:hypothetical protein BGLA2_260083 [Burkholderia gladioli]|nr:hypothetical protein BGLA2_260083 [Burkholderia gladioli]
MCIFLTTGPFMRVGRSEPRHRCSGTCISTSNCHPSDAAVPAHSLTTSSAQNYAKTYARHFSRRPLPTRRSQSSLSKADILQHVTEVYSVALRYIAQSSSTMR